MRRPSGPVFILILICFLGCGGPKRIKKQPVPEENVILCYRLMAEGDQLLKEGKDHLAFLKYLEASQLHPYHEGVFNKLAIAYTRLQMFDQAERAVFRSIGLNPEYSFAYNTHGIIELAQLDPKDAVKSFQKAIRLEPRVANFYINLGYALIQIGRFEDSKGAYQKALEVDPDVLEEKNFVELNFSNAENTDPEKLYQTARMFAQLGSLEFCISYLRRALNAGFIDFERIQEEEAFDPFRDEEVFQLLLQYAGIST